MACDGERVKRGQGAVRNAPASRRDVSGSGACSGGNWPDVCVGVAGGDDVPYRGPVLVPSTLSVLGVEDRVRVN